MVARKRDFQVGFLAAAPFQGAGETVVPRMRIEQAAVGVLGEAVRLHAQVRALAAHAGGQGPGALVVGAADEQAVGGQQRGEGVERLVDRLDRAVVVKVVGLDVGDHHDVGLVVHERGVGFVGLGDKDLAGAVLGVEAEAGDVGADRKGRGNPGLAQHEGDQRGGRGLAVGAGHGDDVVALHGRGQSLGAVQDPQAARNGLVVFRVAGLDDRGDHHGVGIAQVFGRVADVDARPGLAEVVEHRKFLGVGSGDRQSAGQHEPGNGRDPHAADAHQVDFAELVESM